MIRDRVYINKKKFISYLTEIRDNTPSIYEENDQVYYNMMTEMIKDLGA